MGQTKNMPRKTVRNLLLLSTFVSVHSTNRVYRSSTMLSLLEFEHHYVKRAKILL